MAGNFFAIGKSQWEQACDLGLNPAIAFLILACGTGKDNSTTRWGAKSVEMFGNISWVRAKAAILTLEKAGLARNVTKPRKHKPSTRKLTFPSDMDQALWLPNSLVMGVGGADSPIACLRRAQDVKWLQAFVELYGMQDLAGDGGLPRNLVRKPFTRTDIGERGQFKVYGFEAEGLSHCNTVGPLAHFKANERTEQGWPSWIFLNALLRLGLLEVVEYLAEGDSCESELLHPLSGDAKAEEVAAAIVRAIDAAPDWMANIADRKSYKYVIPVLRDYLAPAVVGVYRLTHRPHTRLTSAWYAKHMEAYDRYTRIYGAIERCDFRAAIAI